MFVVLLTTLIQMALGQTSAKLSAGELVIYTSRTSDLLGPVLQKYQEKTGVRFKVVNGEPGPLLQKLQSEGNKSPADLFITVDAGNLVHAAQLSLFQPLPQSLKGLDQIPAAYRDPRGQWVGLSLRARTLFYDQRKVKASDLESYEGLATEKWKGKLCMRTSRKVYNQSLVAGLIGRLGPQKTEDMVRGWVKNLALPVFTSDSQLLEAIEQGKCQVGIANTYYLARLQAEGKANHVKAFWPDLKKGGVHVNLSGVGLVKTSTKKPLAEAFITWLLSQEAQKIFADANHEYSVLEGVQPTSQVRAWGPFKADPTPLDSLFKHQKEAVLLMDRAGYL